MASCQRPFDEALLSGYLDSALIQLDEQRVRIHLENCPHCRRLLGELASLRAAARATHFARPADDQWREIPRGALSRGFRGAGWVLVSSWALASAIVVGVVIWRGMAAWMSALVLAGVAGFALLLGSVLVDRLRSWKSDPYREVEK